MYNRPVISKLVAISLILVFSLKSGAGLFIHNIFHSKDVVAEHPVKDRQASKGLNYACSCIDEFFMPVDDAVANNNQQRVLFPDPPVCFLEEPLLFHTPFFACLRGPPAFSL
jgi:hypothetical protein